MGILADIFSDVGMIAIDLGSNTLRCVKYDCLTQKFTQNFEAIVRTADGLHRTHKINEASVQRIITALEEANKRLDFSTQKVVAVTTAAMRMASNSADVIEQIYQATGVKFSIISGDEEAKLTILAVKKRLDLLKIATSSFVLVDVGGGSTEITFYHDDEITTTSFDIGVVTLMQMTQNMQNIDDTMETLFKEVVDYVDKYYATYEKPKVFVQTAGTPTTMAAFLQGMDYTTYDGSKINGYELHQEDCPKVMQALSQMDRVMRSKFVGVGREDLILVGIAIIQKIYQVLGFEDSIVIDDSLREGVAFSSCN